MEKPVYEHYINNGLQHDFTGIEPGTIVGVELIGAFNITPEVSTENENISYVYNLNSEYPFKYGFLKNNKPTIILMEVVDEHTGKLIKSEDSMINDVLFLVGDEKIETYIEKDLYDSNVTEEIELEIFKKIRDMAIILNPMSIIKVNDEETKKQILEEYHNSDFLYYFNELFRIATNKYYEKIESIIENDVDRSKQLKKEEQIILKRTKFIKKYVDYRQHIIQLWEVPKTKTK